MKPQNLKPALREFAGGYVNTAAGVVKDEGVGSHLQRNAGAYIGTAMFPVVGTGIGAVIDQLRKRSNIVKTKDEFPVSARTAAALGLNQRPVLMGRDLKPALRELAARSERVVELARGDYAIPALKKALKRGVGNGGDPVSIHEIGVSGTAIPSLRGNPGNVRRALNKFWESPHDMQEATGLMKGTRKWAAQTIRESRQDPRGREAIFRRAKAYGLLNDWS